MSESILHLTLYREWFMQIARGVKREEYREKSEWWKRKLEGKSYSEIHFRNGYRPDAHFMRVEFLGVKEGTYLGRDVFAIQLGQIIEIRWSKRTEGIRLL